MHRSPPLPLGARAAVRTALLLPAPLLVAGCSKAPTQPVDCTIHGHVTLMIPLTDAAGDTTGLVADSSATGIIIRLLDGRGLSDSVTTTNGTFKLRVGGDAYQLVAGPTLLTSDTPRPFIGTVTAP